MHKPNITFEEKVAIHKSVFVSKNTVLDRIGIAVETKTPFTSLSLGDGELIFLMCPEIINIEDYKKYLKYTGIVSPEKLSKYKKYIIDNLANVDIAFCHDLPTKDYYESLFTNGPEWAIFFYSYFELYKYYNIPMTTSFSGCLNRYAIVGDGSLFNILKGTKVLLIGFYAPTLEALLKRDDYLSYYRNINIENLDVAGSIIMQPFNGMEDIEYVLSEIPKYNFDVAIMAAGAASKYLGLKLKEMGKIAIDIGHTMDGLVGIGDTKRPHMDKFTFGIGKDIC